MEMRERMLLSSDRQQYPAVRTKQREGPPVDPDANQARRPDVAASLLAWARPRDEVQKGRFAPLGRSVPGWV
jgi:hypothetical protein